MKIDLELFSFSFFKETHLSNKENYYKFFRNSGQWLVQFLNVKIKKRIANDYDLKILYRAENTTCEPKELLKKQ